MPQVTEEEYRKLHPERPRIYDIGLDEYRDVTQKDADTYSALMSTYGRLRAIFAKTHDELMAAIKPE